MSRKIFTGLLLAAATTAPCAADDEPDWLPDLPTAKATARATGKPIFLVFRCER